MPRGDGTGPWGLGPMTGRAAGYCAGYNVPGFANPYGGRGLGFGRGWWGRGGGGYGWRHMYYATGLPGWARYGQVTPVGTAWAAAPQPVQEVEALKAQAEYLQRTLEAINKRLEELEKE
ncbi:MAG: DUF5320 domain-containing protein [Anaerolineae bacterium]|nr:DUF5320 domain-containing protein [Anaerolineae bacterium]